MDIQWIIALKFETLKVEMAKVQILNFKKS